jgi:argininosuccinate lyase
MPTRPTDTAGTPDAGAALRLGARVKEAPAPELVAAAGRLETGDADVLWRDMGLADLAHVLALVEDRIIPVEPGRRLLQHLLDLAQVPLADLRIDPALGDLYSNREHWISARDAEAGGWLSAGRARREATTVGYRLAVRRRLLGFAAAIGEAGRAALDQAERHVGTMMPDYTYLQQAHPTTLGHYLTSFVYPMLRDLERVRGCFARANTGAGGVGSINGSRLPLDRDRLAAALAFDGPIVHARDAMWQADAPVETLALVVACLVNLDRLAEDLMIWATSEFGLVELADRHSRASVIMPQKKNPYALAWVRGAAGTMIGRLAGMAAVGRTPSAQVDNRIFAYGEVPRSLDEAASAARLMAGVLDGLAVDTALMARRAMDGHAQATDLAEVIMSSCGLNYRDAHRVVGLVVRRALERGLPLREVGPGAIDEAARAVLGRPLDLSAALVAGAVDPRQVVHSRTGRGGAAPDSVRRMIGECRDQLRDAGTWCLDTQARLETAETRLVTRAAELCRAHSANGTRPTRQEN